MTNENERKQLDEKNLKAAAGGKPQRVIVPDVDKLRDKHDAAGGLTEGGDCGGGIEPPIRRTDDVSGSRLKK